MQIALRYESSRNGDRNTVRAGRGRRQGMAAGMELRRVLADVVLEAHFECDRDAAISGRKRRRRWIAKMRKAIRRCRLSLEDPAMSRRTGGCAGV